MGEVIVSLANGRRVAFNINLSGSEPPCFVLGIRKCGSTLINNMCRMLANMNSRHVVLADVFFRANVRENEWSKDPAVCDLLHPGNIYGGFRMMPAAFANHPLFRENAKILMVRDPRDALVSEYFSLAYSHPVPAKTESGSGLTEMMEELRQRALETEIDTLVLKRAAGMRKVFLDYVEVVSTPGTIVIRYEDYIFRKDDLIRLLANHFGMIASPEQVSEVLRVFDKRPEIEDPKAFVRRVTPGDHRDKLRPETVIKLNKILQPAMAAFDYRAE